MVRDRVSRPDSKGIRLVALLGLYLSYFLSYFIKLSPSIIMPILQEKYGFSSGQTGFIASMYFLPYAAMQFFIGTLCRRFGAGKTVGTGLAISALGLLIFSKGTTVPVLAIGRFLLGLGTSPIFIGMLHYMRNAFESERYARYYGLGIFVSGLGSIFAAAPLKAILRVVDANGFFVCLSALAFCLGIMMFLIDRKPEDHYVSGGILRGIGRDIKLVFTTPVLLAGLCMWLVQAPSLVCYQGLWCTKWTEVAFPTLSRLSGWSGIAISIGSILSSLFCERLTNFYARRTGKTRGRILSEIGSVQIFATLLLGISKLTCSVPMFAFSMFCDVLFGFTTGTIIVQSGVHVKENTAAERNAAVMGVYNGIGCTSQQLSQWLTGISIDVFVVKTSLNTAFFLTFGFLAVVFVFLTTGCAVLIKKGKG